MASPTPPSDTVWREIQLRYKLAPPSFKNLLAIHSTPSRQDVLRQACYCTEFATFPFSPADKPFFREVNDHCPIPYRIPQPLEHSWQKVFLLVQIDLARCGWPNKLSAVARKELHSERGRIYKVLDQVLRCLVDILGQKLDGSGVVTALDVLRSVTAGAWEGNGMDLLQIEGIGPAKAQKLNQAGIKTIQHLSKLEFYHIERLLSRNPPFGQQLHRKVSGFPRLVLTVRSVEDHPYNTGIHSTQPGSSQQPMLRILLWYENEELPIWDKKSPWTTLTINGEDGRLLWFWRGSIKRLTGRKDMVVRLPARCHETVHVIFACETIVGTVQRATVEL
ncbi:hypothetical protein NLU13_7686 [Sarocladium strictum]|uniref:SEC63 domain-containing protein n=1 Tax=Sarocladium strictum TaxID=5046 RepID=A0AA39GER3_SARSR|nr:hypothetical protein NLU13_7686 [Sarocladium strictum]